MGEWICAAASKSGQKIYLLRTSPPLTLRRSRATSTTSSDNVEHVSAVNLALNVDTRRLGTIEILCGRALQGYSGHCWDTLCWALLGYSAEGTAGILCGWALQGYSAVGHCRDTLRLGTAGILCGWALLGYFVVGHCKDTLRLGTACWDTLRLGTAGILCSWALQSGSGRARTT